MKKIHRHTGLGFGHIVSELVARGCSGPDSVEFQRFVSRLIQTRGYVGAIQYLDDLGVLVTSHLSGEKAPKTRTWISKCRGLPKRIRAFKGNRKALRSLSKAKRVVRVRNVTNWQQKKFLTAVSRPIPDPSGLAIVRRYITRGASSLRRLRSYGNSNCHISEVGSLPELCVIKTLSRADEVSVLTDASASELYVRNLRHILSHGLENNPYVLKACGLTTRPDDLDGSSCDVVTYTLDTLWKERGPWSDKDERGFVGRLGFSQEPGGKLRVFASPWLIYQAALRPLYKCLMGWLSAIPEDCCHDQNRGVQLAAKKLAAGQEVYSFDLSSATDTFPVELQYAVLNGYDEQIRQVLRSVVKGYWKPPQGFPKAPITWAVGQPLGVLPSFAWFSLTHHALVRGIAASLGICPDGQYAILGDDIVIFHRMIAERYRLAMSAIGVEISPTKSHVSALIAEFAGTTVLQTGETFAPGKWREPKSSNLLSKVSDPDYDWRAVVPKPLITLVERVGNMPYPVGFRRPSDEEVSQLPYEVREEYYKLLLRPFKPSMDWSTIPMLTYATLYRAGLDHLVYERPMNEGLRSSDPFLSVVREYNSTYPPYYRSDAFIPECGIDSSLPTWQDQACRALHMIIWEVIQRDDLSVDHWLERFPPIRAQAEKDGLSLLTRFDFIEYLLVIFPYKKANHLCTGKHESLWRRLKAVMRGKDVLVSPEAFARYARHPLRGGKPTIT